MLGPSEIFTAFFITIGPLEVFGPFAAQTRDLAPAAIRGIALRVFVLSVVALGAGGWIGRSTVLDWDVSTPALLIAGGVILFLVALRIVLQPYDSALRAPSPPLPAAPLAAALEFAFPSVITPYGLAVLVAMLAATQDTGRIGLIFAIAFAVLVLDLLAMLFARIVMRGWVLLGMRLLGTVMAVLQVALAVQMILRAFMQLGVLTG